MLSSLVEPMYVQTTRTRLLQKLAFRDNARLIQPPIQQCTHYVRQRPITGGTAGYRIEYVDVPRGRSSDICTCIAVERVSTSIVGHRIMPLKLSGARPTAFTTVKNLPRTTVATRSYGSVGIVRTCTSVCNTSDVRIPEVV